jgi:hypothetical protein
MVEVAEGFNTLKSKDEYGSRDGNYQRFISHNLTEICIVLASIMDNMREK